MRLGKRIQVLTLAGALLAISTINSAGIPGEARPHRLQPSADNDCAACHSKLIDGAVALFAQSTHSRRRVACSSCHRGGAASNEKTEAHGGDFIGQPTGNQVLNMCGSCHTAQLNRFKTSSHFPERRGVPRVDCVQCHGAHTVGSPARDFSLDYYCAGCHGLEYMPELPEAFRKVLAAADSVNDAARELATSGKPSSDEATSRRRDFRILLGEIVHSTDLKRGVDSSGHLVEQGEALKQIMARNKR